MGNVKVSLFDVVESLSNVMDMASPMLVGHHKRVAFIAMNISNIACRSTTERNDALLAALLHDCGALSLKDKLEALKFEFNEPNRHSELGYRFLRNFKHLESIAQIVRYHHTYWESELRKTHTVVPMPYQSHIIHIADRVDVLLDKEKELIGQADYVREVIRKESGRMFDPELVEVFLNISDGKDFWTGVGEVCRKGPDCMCFRDFELDHEEMLQLVRMIEKIIDFRSRFTATHSRGVSAVAEELARAYGMDEEDTNLVKVAGYLHDLGKLAVPAEILEKRSGLSPQEIIKIREHALYSYNTLEKIKGFEQVNLYASLHHEKLNGTGYPFSLKAEDLSAGSRIIGVADIFTAVTEDRPYRKGIDGKAAVMMLKSMAERMEVDPDIVQKLEENYENINSIRMKVQLEAIQEYEKFLQS